jgi:hypothetical protein
MTKRARILSDETLNLILGEINKSVEPVPKGYRTEEQWAEKWKYTRTNTKRYIRVALEAGILVRKDLRIVTKGRRRLMAHYGPPIRRKNKQP